MEISFSNQLRISSNQVRIFPQLLFVGDSTIRGMMHYLIEKLNGSLNLYEKTHSLRIYSNLNAASTLFGFSYYPRFWIYSDMPSLTSTVLKLRNQIELDNKLDDRFESRLDNKFDNTLDNKLDDKVDKVDNKVDNLYSNPGGELDDGRETVIVVGGVHWMSTKHITKLHKLTQSFPNTRLILKSLGKRLAIFVFEFLLTSSLSFFVKFLCKVLSLSFFVKFLVITLLDPLTALTTNSSPIENDVVNDNLFKKSQP